MSDQRLFALGMVADRHFDLIANAMRQMVGYWDEQARTQDSWVGSLAGSQAVLWRKAMNDLEAAYEGDPDPDADARPIFGDTPGEGTFT